VLFRSILAPHLDEGEGSLGVLINVSHTAATLPGQTVTVDATCTKVEGRRIGFHVKAHDGIDLISEGEHERMIVRWDLFEQHVNKKAKRARLDAVLQKAL